MSVPADMHARHARNLERLTELGMALCEQVQADAMAGAVEQRAELALVFHRVARGVRQTMALAERFERLKARAEREAADHREKVRAAAVKTRVKQVETAVERLVWDEYEGVAPDELSGRLDAILAQEQLTEAFLDETITAHVQRICKLLDIGPPPDFGQPADDQTTPDVPIKNSA